MRIAFRRQITCPALALLLLLGAMLCAAPARGQTPASKPAAPAEAGETGEPAAEEPLPEPTPAPPEASQLAQRLEETSTELRRLHGLLTQDKDSERIHRDFPQLRQRLDKLNERQDEIDQPAMGVRKLHDLENEWKTASTQLQEWAEILTQLAKQLDDILTALNNLSEEWRQNRENSADDALPEAVVQRIDTALQELSATKEEVKTRRARLLELQNAVSEEIVDTGTVLEILEKRRREQQERLLLSDSPPLWTILATFHLQQPVWKQIVEAYTKDAASLYAFLREDWEPFAWQLFLFVALAALIGSLDRQSRRTSFQDPALAAAARVLRTPYSAAFLIAALASPWIHPLAPGGLLEFVGLAIIPAVYRVLPPGIRDRRDGSLGLILGLYLFSSLAGQVNRTSDIHRIFMLIEAIGGITLLVRFLKPAPEAPSSSLWGFLMRFGRRTLIGGLALGLAANTLGNVGLADLLTQGLLNSGFIAGMLFGVSRVLEGVVIMLPRTGSFGSIDLVRRNVQMFARRGIGLVRFGSAFVWTGFVLRIFEVRDRVIGGLQSMMNATWKVGSLEVSAANLIVFVVAIFITTAAARSLSFILRHDILPKLDLPRGVPGAISSATQYLILGLGFLVSLAVAGVDLGSIALVAGGLGVGIGFGLQNIVNNFVSGLILLFERPVRDGDFIQAATTFGEVKRIGFRSSTIRTFFGAEVIVPNAELISQTVINWTLSDQNRNQEFPVRVAYGADPGAVIELLKSVAAKHENTLEDPSPNAFFVAYGENSLEFSLRFWAPFDVGFTTRSDVAVAVERALQEAGLAAPIPHRVVRLEGTVPTSDPETRGPT